MISNKAFTDDELEAIKHALLHLEHNNINKEMSSGGWYTGNKKHFIKKHEKAINMMKEWVEHGSI